MLGFVGSSRARLHTRKQFNKLASFSQQEPRASKEDSMAQTNSDVAEISGRAESWNVRLLGHSELAGHGDGSRIDKKGDYLFVAHMKAVAVRILNVADPRNPRVVYQLEKAPGV